MNIVFITLTPLAGAPIRIANALNQYTDYKVRVIDLNPNCYGKRVFPEDLDWIIDKEQCLEIISKADILQFFHFFDFETDNNPFKFNFLANSKREAKFVRMFESDLNYISQGNQVDESIIMIPKERILQDKYPKLVIPHYPERTFLDAFIVPNIIPINDEILSPKEVNNDIPKVFYSASSPNSMWITRCNTKGLPEIDYCFNKLKEKANFEFQTIQNLPYVDCQKIKQNSDIVIGDITSGSYHLTDLESLSQGKPTFTYLDSRSQLTLTNLLGCSDLPFINTRLEEIDLPFLELINDVSLQNELGEFSRFWIEKYYNERNLVKFYEEAYEKVLNGENLHRQSYLEFKEAKIFLYNKLYDLQWQSRKNSYFKDAQNPNFLPVVSTKNISEENEKKTIDTKYSLKYYKYKIFYN